MNNIFVHMCIFADFDMKYVGPTKMQGKKFVCTNPYMLYLGLFTKKDTKHAL